MRRELEFDHVREYLSAVFRDPLRSAQEEQSVEQRTQLASFDLPAGADPKPLGVPLETALERAAAESNRPQVHFVRLEESQREEEGGVPCEDREDPGVAVTDGRLVVALEEHACRARRVDVCGTETTAGRTGFSIDLPTDRCCARLEGPTLEEFSEFVAFERSEHVFDGARLGEELGTEHGRSRPRRSTSPPLRSANESHMTRRGVELELRHAATTRAQDLVIEQVPERRSEKSDVVPDDRPDDATARACPEPRALAIRTGATEEDLDDFRAGRPEFDPELGRVEAEGVQRSRALVEDGVESIGRARLDVQRHASRIEPTRDGRGSAPRAVDEDRIETRVRCGSGSIERRAAAATHLDHVARIDA